MTLAWSKYYVMKQAIFSKERLAVTLRFFATGKKKSWATSSIVKVALHFKFLLRHCRSRMRTNVFKICCRLINCSALSICFFVHAAILYF